MTRISIKEKHLCCGCQACAQRCPKQCIVMCEDEEGFIYPEVDVTQCIACGLCVKVCPVINQDNPKQPKTVYAAEALDDEIIKSSSSGGIFSLLAEQTILAGGVVFGARFDENWEVVHGYTETIEGLDVLCGSKYVQSHIGNSFLQAEAFLKTGRKVLFSGTPCQIAGLNNFLQRKYENLLTVDVICHGVPSPMIWRKYLKEIAKNQCIKNIFMRDKMLGWRRYCIRVDGMLDTILYEEFTKNIYMQGFLLNLYLRPSCYECPAKKFKSQSDITLGDYWGIQNQYPELYNKLGTSAVLVNTIKGYNVFNRLHVKKTITTYSSVLSGNPSIEKSVATKYREYFWQRYHTDGNLAVVKRIWQKTRPSILYRTLSRMKSTVCRILKKII